MTLPLDDVAGLIAELREGIPATELTDKRGGVLGYDCHVGNAEALMDRAADAIERLTANQSEGEAVDRSHNWIKSPLGHGESYCTQCHGTNREIAVIGDMNVCEKAPNQSDHTDAHPSGTTPQPGEGGVAAQASDWYLEQRAFHAANQPQTVEVYQELVRDLWKACCAQEALALPTPPASTATPSETSREDRGVSQSQPSGEAPADAEVFAGRNAGLSEALIERLAYEASVWAKDPAHNIGADQPSLVFARRFAFLLLRATTP